MVVAAGGFERNDEMRKKYQRAPIEASWTVGNFENTGDGILAGEAIGAKLDVELMQRGLVDARDDRARRRYNNVLMLEKSLPHGMFVNRNAQRFVNEGESYNDLVIDMYEQDAKDHATVPGWFIVDATYRLALQPRARDARIRHARQEDAPRAGGRARAGCTRRTHSKTLPARSTSTPRRCAGPSIDSTDSPGSGVDEDFHRGASANDRYYSDPRAKPNPTLGPIETPPFYAVPLSPSDLGTKSGLVTDNDGRVLDEDDRPIPGLYGAGNSTSTVMGTRYGGAGATIGPAMVFGFLCGEAIATDAAGT